MFKCHSPNAALSAFAAVTFILHFLSYCGPSGHAVFASPTLKVLRVARGGGQGAAFPSVPGFFSRSVLMFPIGCTRTQAHGCCHILADLALGHALVSVQAHPPRAQASCGRPVLKSLRNDSSATSARRKRLPFSFALR